MEPEKHCLICCQSYDDTDVKKEPNENETTERKKIFELLSSSLKVKPSTGWNFEIEPLPFCERCKKSAEKLLSFQQQLESTHNRMYGLVEEIRNVILETRRNECSFGPADERLLKFRRQIKDNNLPTASDSNDTRQLNTKRPRILLEQLDSNRSVGEENSYFTPECPESFLQGDIKSELEPVDIADYLKVEFNVDSIHSTSTNQYTETESDRNIEADSSEDEDSTAKSPDTNFTLLDVNKIGREKRRRSDRLQKLARQAKLQALEDADSDWRGDDGELSDVTLGRIISGETKQKTRPEPDFQLKCTECEQMFNRKSIWKSHMISMHQAKHFECSICGKPGTSSKTLRRHLSTHKSKEEIEASIDGGAKLPPHVEGYVKSDAKAQDNKTLKQKYQCEVCDKELSSRSCLLRHSSTHSAERNYACGQCQKTYKTSDDLKAHQKLQHVNDPHKFQCGTCLKTFRLKKSYIEHCRTHTGEKPYQCDQCGKSFATSSYFYRHKTTHKLNQPTFTCSNCGVVFKSKKNLLAHVKNKHSSSAQEVLGQRSKVV